MLFAFLKAPSPWLMRQSHQPVCLGISSGKNASSARTADTIGGKIVLETNTFFGQPVDIVRMDCLDTITAYMPPNVMAGYHQYVRIVAFR